MRTIGELVKAQEDKSRRRYKEKTKKVEESSLVGWSRVIASEAKRMTVNTRIKEFRSIHAVSLELAEEVRRMEAKVDQIRANNRILRQMREEILKSRKKHGIRRADIADVIGWEPV